MGIKEKKSNTIEEVQRRIRRLEDHLMEMEPTSTLRQILPEYKLSPLAYEGVILDLLRRNEVPFTRQLNEHNQSATILGFPPDHTPSHLEREKLDLTERVYRLSSKILQIVREREDPTPYNSNIIRALAPFSTSEFLYLANIISNLFSGDKNLDIARTIFVDGFGELFKKYNIPEIKEVRAHKRGYSEALYHLLEVAEQLKADYKKNNVPEKLKKEVLEGIRNPVMKDRIQQSRRLDLDYLERLSLEQADEAISQLQSDFGILAGVHYSGNRERRRSAIELWLIDTSSGKPQKYVVNADGKSTTTLRDFVLNHLYKKTIANHTDMALVGSNGKKVAELLEPHRGLLASTKAHYPKLERYFR